ncbi:MAG: acyl carrier protein [Eubacterium sp.]|nr:acyl carrier protein [Eubacterium sp.]
MSFEELQDIIVENIGCEADQVTLEASLSEDLGADSLAAVELVMAIEEASGITIDDSEVANFKTVGDIMNFLAAHQE